MTKKRHVWKQTHTYTLLYIFCLLILIIDAQCLFFIWCVSAYVCVCGNTDLKRIYLYIQLQGKIWSSFRYILKLIYTKIWEKLDYYFDVFEILKNKNRYFICSDVSVIMTNNKYRKKNVRKFRLNRKNKWKILWKMKTVRIFFLTNFMYEWMQYKNKK